ncbi:MAG: nucleotidyltransferase domain-containing protein [Burkholderiaceae bacterium]
MLMAPAPISVALLLTQVSFNALTDWVLLTGSFAEGAANSGSDIDIIVVGRQPDQLQGSHFNSALDRWLDTSYMDEQALRDVRARVELNDVLPETWGDHQVASLDCIDVYHRLTTARLLASPKATGVPWPMLDHTRLVREAAITHLIIARARWEDAAGALTDGDVEQCAFVAEIGLWHAVDSIAALFGLTNPSSKWRLKRLQKLVVMAAYVAQVEQRLVQRREALGASADLLGLLGDVIYQATHMLVTGVLADTVPSPPASPGRVEVDRKGLLLVRPGTKAEYLRRAGSELSRTTWPPQADGSMPRKSDVPS